SKHRDTVHIRFIRRCLPPLYTPPIIHSLPTHSSSLFFFFSCSRDHRDLHSFPTRRSSDLLVTRFFQYFSWRSNKCQTVGRCFPCSLSIFSHETITWVDGVSPCCQSNVNDAIDIKICPDRVTCLSDPMCFICLWAMDRVSIFLRE